MRAMPRSAIVTGSSRGIGRAIAIELARAGYDVYVNCSTPRSLDTARDLADSIAEREGVRDLAVAADVSHADEAARLADVALEEFGRIDVLVNNAGITRDGLIAKMDEASFDEVIDVNLKGAFNCCKAVTRAMMRQRGGRIINMSSVVGVRGNAGQANYAASKAGVTGLTLSLAKELAPRNVTVNAIAPGFIETDMTNALGEKARASIAERIDLVCDEESFEEWDVDMPDADPLSFPSYREKVASVRLKTGAAEAVRTGVGSIEGMRCALAFMDSSFLMGSMGTTVGEKIARLFDRARTRALVTASDSARRDERALSLISRVPGLRRLAKPARKTATRTCVRNGAADRAKTGGAWESVLLARNVRRPTAAFYLDRVVEGFVELHGDRSFSDDAAVIGGIGWMGERAVTVIAQEKGSDLKDRIRRNFGCPQPEGYRKSLRLMKQAEKFGRPVVCIVDTQGAFCGTEAEERGQGNAIAENLAGMAALRTPIASVLIGEGGSGGALALAVANHVAMQEHAVYSVLSPEGFASILWKDRARAPEAADAMRMSAREAHELGVVDAVLSEGRTPAHENPEQAALIVKNHLVRVLDELSELEPEQAAASRQQRFARF